MKRIYACILIVAALLGISLYSSGRVQGFAQDISADLDCALELCGRRISPLRGRRCRGRRAVRHHAPDHEPSAAHC